MLKFFILLSILCVVKCNTDLDWFTGEWVSIVQYPGPMFLLGVCNSYTLQKENVTCTCGDQQVQVLRLNSVNDSRITQALPVFVAENSEDVDNDLKIECHCNNPRVLDHTTVLRKINENYAVQYNRPFYLKKEDAHGAIVLTRKVEKLSQIREVLKSIDNLSERKRTFLCQPDFFVNEFDDLD